MMFKHQYVPDYFGKGVIIPILKDVDGNSNSSDNYRGNILSPAVSKLFALCFFDKFSTFLYASNLQFGFKKNTGCNNSLFCLKASITYFNNSIVTVSTYALAIFKAFDKTSHLALFNELIRRSVPISLILMLKNWYSKCVDSFKIVAGVRQG